MGRVRIIMDDIPEGREPLPEDQVYTVEFASVEERVGVKGPYLNCQLKVVDDPLHEGYTLFEILPLPDPKVIDAALALPASMEQKRKEMLAQEHKKCWRTKSAFLATGAQYDSDGFDTNDLLGARAPVRVKTEERLAKGPDGSYSIPTGVYQSRVARYLPKGAVPPTRSDDITF
jgi:hypothetical protein